METPKLTVYIARLNDKDISDESIFLVATSFTEATLIMKKIHLFNHIYRNHSYTINSVKLKDLSKDKRFQYQKVKTQVYYEYQSLFVDRLYKEWIWEHPEESLTNGNRI